MSRKNLKIKHFIDKKGFLLINPCLERFNYWGFRRDKYFSLNGFVRRHLHFDFKIDFEQALAFRKANGDYLRKGQWKDLTVEVYII